MGDDDMCLIRIDGFDKHIDIPSVREFLDERYGSCTLHNVKSVVQDEDFILVLTFKFASPKVAARVLLDLDGEEFSGSVLSVSLLSCKSTSNSQQTPEGDKLTKTPVASPNSQQNSEARNGYTNLPPLAPTASRATADKTNQNQLQSKHKDIPQHQDKLNELQQKQMSNPVYLQLQQQVVQLQQQFILQQQILLKQTQQIPQPQQQQISQFQAIPTQLQCQQLQIPELHQQTDLLYQKQPKPQDLQIEQQSLPLHIQQKTPDLVCQQQAQPIQSQQKPQFDQEQQQSVSLRVEKLSQHSQPQISNIQRQQQVHENLKNPEEKSQSSRYKTHAEEMIRSNSRDKEREVHTRHNHEAREQDETLGKSTHNDILKKSRVDGRRSPPKKSNRSSSPDRRRRHTSRTSRSRSSSRPTAKVTKAHAARAVYKLAKRSQRHPYGFSIIHYVPHFYTHNIESGSPASLVNLPESARVLKVNGHNLDGKTDKDVCEMIHNSATRLTLELHPGKSASSELGNILFLPKHIPPVRLCLVRKQDHSGFGFTVIKDHRDSFKTNSIFASISDVKPNSPAYRSGLRKGHLILEIDGETLTSGANVNASFKNDAVKLLVARVITVRYYEDRNTRIHGKMDNIDIRIFEAHTTGLCSEKYSTQVY